MVFRALKHGMLNMGKPETLWDGKFSPHLHTEGQLALQF